VLRFSKQFLATVESQKQKGYQPKEASVNFVVYWEKEDAEKEIKIVLPEIYLEKP